MATSKDYIAYLEDCLKHIPEIRFKPMFGEYALYCDGIMIGLVCDQTLFIKMTHGTSALLEGKAALGPPYQGAKDAYILTEKEFANPALISAVVICGLRDLSKKSKPAAKGKEKVPAKKKTKL